MLVIKRNLYSNRLAEGLSALRELTSPDHLMAPVDPTLRMARAGAKAGGISQAKARMIYTAMLHAWTEQKPREN
jgi:hypothetical protein